jgi:hypothetical protein
MVDKRHFSSYFIYRFKIPGAFHIAEQRRLLSQGLAKVAPLLASLVSLVFVFTGIISVILSVIKRKKEDENVGRKRELFERQKNLPDISALKWREFEEFIGEAYKRQGYQG